MKLDNLSDAEVTRYQVLFAKILGGDKLTFEERDEVVELERKVEGKAPVNRSMP